MFKNIARDYIRYNNHKRIYGAILLPVFLLVGVSKCLLHTQSFGYLHLVLFPLAVKVGNKKEAMDIGFGRFMGYFVLRHYKVETPSEALTAYCLGADRFRRGWDE